MDVFHANYKGIIEEKTIFIQEVCLALLMSKQDHTTKLSLTMMEEAMHYLHDVDVILLPVILKGYLVFTSHCSR